MKFIEHETKTYLVSSCVVHYLNYDKYKHDYRDINDLQS